MHVSIVCPDHFVGFHAWSPHGAESYRAPTGPVTHVERASDAHGVIHGLYLPRKVQASFPVMPEQLQNWIIQRCVVSVVQNLTESIHAQKRGVERLQLHVRKVCFKRIPATCTSTNSSDEAVARASSRSVIVPSMSGFVSLGSAKKGLRASAGNAFGIGMCFETH